MINKLEWNVFIYDINRKKIHTYNIFEHGGFCKHIKKETSDCNNKEIFSARVRSVLMYFFWCKSEWEIIITSWCGGDREKDAVKIDVYTQVMNNWNVFIDYLWENRKLLGELDE